MPWSPFIKQVLTFTDTRIHWNTTASVLKQVHISCVLQLPQHQDIEMWKHTTQHQNAASGVITVDPLFAFHSCKQAVSTQRVSCAVDIVSITSTWSAHWQFASSRSPSLPFCSVLFSFLDFIFSHWCVCIYEPLLPPPFSFYLSTAFQTANFFVPGGCLQLLILPRLHPAVDRISMIRSSGFVTS